MGQTPGGRRGSPHKASRRPSLTTRAAPRRNRGLPARLPEDPFWKLVATAERLQAPGGCAWDRAQTIQSLLPYLIEETWEVFDSIRGRRPQALQEELGDVLYTVIFLTLIAQRRGWCSLHTLLTATQAKMVRRHPHVFGSATARTSQDAYASWRAVKRQEGRVGSPAKRLRPLLVACWDLLRDRPEAAGAFKRLLAQLRRQPARTRGETSRTPSARPTPVTGRSRHPAPDWSHARQKRKTR